jgi:hypothetical protein
MCKVITNHDCVIIFQIELPIYLDFFKHIEEVLQILLGFRSFTLEILAEI